MESTISKDNNVKATAITKKDAIMLKKAMIPDEIIIAVNSLIIKHLKPDGTAIVTQEEILKEVCGDPECGKLTRDEIFDNHWLDIEDIYREKGWEVFYDQPCFSGSHNAYFEFM